MTAISTPGSELATAPPPVTMPRGPARPSGRTEARHRSPWRPRELLVVFTLTAVLYLVVGGYLAANHVAFADAYSRVANAMYVLYSRFPHLPAMGFVWNPAPSFAVLPLLPLHEVFPSLLRDGIAGVIVSALCMAGAVTTLDVALARLGLIARGWRWILLAAFAAQPIILLYGGSGQSEPMLLLALGITTVGLLGWVVQRRPGQLVVAGLGLGLGYLTRYEAAATALAVGVLVAAVGVAGTPGGPRSRLRTAAGDLVLVAGPFAFTFVLWAGASRILVGQWFPTFSSQYGNSAQVGDMASWIAESTGAGVADRLGYVSQQIVWLAPASGVLAIAALVVAIHRRDLRPIVPIVVFGSVMGFTALASILGASFAWIRFQIAVVPLSILLAGTLIVALGGGRVGGHPPRLTGTRLAAAGLVLLGVLVAIPAQARVLTDTSLNLAREEAPMLRALLRPAQANADDESYLHLYDTERAIAAHIDALDLPDGSVLGDSAYIYPMLLATARPRQYVITSDPDFTKAVADPSGHGIQYILVSSRGSSDAVQLANPDLFSRGAGIATLAGEWQGYRLGTWRLYRVN